MAQAIKYGKSIKNFIVENLDQLFTEGTLEDKVCAFFC